MGEEITDNPGVRNVYLQVNTQAKSTGLKEWLAKNPHGNLATGQIDMNTPKEDQQGEAKRFINNLVEQRKKNL